MSERSTEPISTNDREALGRIAYEAFPHPDQAAWDSDYYTETERECWRREGQMAAKAVLPDGYVAVGPDELAAIGRAATLLEARTNVLSHIRDRDPKFGEAFRAARDAFTQSDIDSLKALIERTAKP